MLVSVIPVTCHNELVVIVGTFVDVHLLLYAVCVDNADCNHVTSPVCPFTLVTGNAIDVSVIHVTCPNVLVVIVGTLVLVPLEVYAVCVVKASCLLLQVVLNPVLSARFLISKSDAV
jgi:hypothetical protein